MGRKPHKPEHNTLIDVKELHKRLSANLAAIRKDILNETQKNLAKNIDVSQGAVSLAEGVTEENGVFVSWDYFYRFWMFLNGYEPCGAAPRMMGRLIKESRLMDGRGPIAIAANAGLSLQRYKKIEAGSVIASVDDVYMLAKALRVEMDNFTGFINRGIRPEDLFGAEPPIPSERIQEKR